jgi:hypothetical protein
VQFGWLASEAALTAGSSHRVAGNDRVLMRIVILTTSFHDPYVSPLLPVIPPDARRLPDAPKKTAEKIREPLRRGYVFHMCDAGDDARRDGLR